MSLNRIFKIAIPLADALSAAHEKGVIHRDLKPGNIMVTSEGRVKVLDFGLAKLALDAEMVVDTEMPTEPLTDEGRMLGTIPYMSPEQLDGDALDARTDIFSLGVILYELATGERPFQGAKSASVISAIMRDDPEVVDTIREDLPHHLGRVINHCLEKDRDNRYQSAKDVRNELEGLRKEVETGPTSGVTSVAKPKRTRRPSLIAAIVVVATLLVVGVWLFSRNLVTPPKLTDEDRIVLTDFFNTTGDPVFDDTLTQALSVKLQESPYLSVLPRRQVQESLRLMKRSPEETVTAAIGQEICQRQGLRAMVTGAIGSLGTNYAITLDAVDCRSGESLAATVAEVSTKEEVLSAIGRGAVEIRRDLGESLASIEQFDAPIEEATTWSLEALKALAMGDRTRDQGTEEEAILFYKRALELDPDFAFAHARLGNAYANMREYENARYYKSQAYELRENVSERERLYITGHYHNTVTGDLNKVIETYELFKQAYPRESVAANNLCSSFEEYGMFERALAECELAMSLDSENPLHGLNAAQVLRDLGRLDESKQVLDEALGKGFVRSGLYNNRYLIAYLDGDQETMDRMIEAMASVPGESEILFFDAEGVAASGRLEGANRLNRRAMDIARNYGFVERTADLLARSALWDADFGRIEDSAAKAVEALAIARSRDSMTAAAIGLAFAGATREAESLIQELTERYPDTDTQIYSVWLPIIRAAIAIQEGDAALAIEQLEAVRPYERRFLKAIYLRGLAYLMLERPERAKAEFEKILSLRGVDPTKPIHTLVHLQLGRALLSIGKTDAARESYSTFLGLVSEADAGLPAVEAGTNEYAALGPPV